MSNLTIINIYKSCGGLIKCHNDGIRGISTHPDGLFRIARRGTTSIPFCKIWLLGRAITLPLRNIGAIRGGLGHRGRSHDEQRFSAGLGRIAAILYPDIQFAVINRVNDWWNQLGSSIHFLGGGKYGEHKLFSSCLRELIISVCFRLRMIDSCENVVSKYVEWMDWLLQKSLGPYTIYSRILNVSGIRGDWGAKFWHAPASR